MIILIILIKYFFTITLEIYLLNSPSVSGANEARCAIVAPALCPPSVTCSGSPPKDLALVRTQRSSVMTSRIALLPGILGVFNDKKPNTFSLELKKTIVVNLLKQIYN